MKISVLIPTNRPDSLALAQASLDRQSFKDFEILVGSPQEPSFGRWVKDDFEGGYWSLNRVYNRLISESRGELLVSLQDFIWVPPDGLQKFWNVYARTRGATTGIGDSYVTVGLEGEHGPPFWRDPRRILHRKPSIRDDETMRQVKWLSRAIHHEWNYGSFPRQAILNVGGMDEELDFLGYGCDNLSANERMFEHGTPCFIDFGNEIVAQHHHKPAHWERLALAHGKYHSRKMELKERKSWPVLTDEGRMPSRHRDPLP